jgi:microcin C transport system ATP-binding protein
MSLLSVRDLSVAFRQGERETLAVDRVSFDVAKGETVALVGESGSGKSVTALSVLKLLPYPAAHHPSGSISFKGQELVHLPEREIRKVRGDDITIIFQEPMTSIFQEPMTSLNPLHTIERQITEILERHHGPAARACHRALEPGRHSRSAEPARELPASALGREGGARRLRPAQDLRVRSVVGMSDGARNE